MIGALAIATAFLAAASDSDEPEALARFRMLYGLGDRLGAYRQLFLSLAPADRNRVLEGLLGKIASAESLQGAADRMNDLVVAGYAYDEISSNPIPGAGIAYDLLKRSYADESKNPAYFRPLPSVSGVKKGVPGQLAAYSPLFFIESPNYGAYSRIWGAEGDLRIVDARFPGMAGLPGAGEFVVVHKDELSPCTILPVSATVDPSDLNGVDVVVQLGGFPSDDEDVEEGVDPNERSLYLLAPRGEPRGLVFGDGGEAEWLANRITDGSSVESLTKSDILTPEVEKAAREALWPLGSPE